MSKTRKSHFLSRFYLGGFTISGRKEDRFWVFSKAQKRQWPMRAEEAGHKRDLFRLEGAGVPADELENGFGSIENEIAPVLRTVLSTKQLPSDPESFSLLLHLPALNAARPPAEIAELADLTDRIIRNEIVEQLTPELHHKILNEWRSTGRGTDAVEDLTELKERISVGTVRAVLSKNHLLTQVTARAARLVDINHTRRWTLLHTSAEMGFFVCTDRPVFLLNNQNVPADIQPRFDDQRFDVIMPLSKDLCLIGHFLRSPGTMNASRESVGFINYLTHANAADFVYSPTKTSNIALPPNIGVHTLERYKADLLGMRSSTR
ncbi:MAG TPA: DUF4238 domain-containing protein [Longimicrobium sp.]|jgi:hypothetical protein